MTQIEQILLNRVKLIEDDSWSLIGSPNSLIKELEALIATQIQEAKIQELEYMQQHKEDVRLGSKSWEWVADRLAQLRKDK